VPVVEGVRRGPGGITGAGHFSVSSTGSLIYIPGPISTSSTLEIALTDRQGVVEPLDVPPGPYVAPRVSPDGKRIAVSTDDGREAIVWIYDLSGTAAIRRLTFGGNNRFPIWSSDSGHVAFQSDRDGDSAIFWQPVDGRAVERITKPEQGTAHTPEAWSPNGDWLLYTVTKGSDLSLWTFSLRDKSVTPFDAVHSSNPIGAVFSPDGRWVAYTTTERGSATVYVQPFPATGAKYQLFGKAFDSPHEVAWSPSGKELFYNPRPGALEVVSVTTEPTVAFGNPVLVAKPFQTGPAAARRSYDITPGGRFVGLIQTGTLKPRPGDHPLSVQTDPRAFAAPQPLIHVVLNWSEELKARVPTK
jgi:serine/threonine-protein kinase